jgi:transcriptional repressor NrdR
LPTAPLICPTCRKSETRVVDSRDDESVVRRRRECLGCKHRFTTYERMEAPRLSSSSRKTAGANSTTATSPQRLAPRLREAARLRGADGRDLVAGLERDLFSRGENEVPATMVGEKLMEALKRARQGRLHPLRQRLPLVRRRREFQAELAELAK